MDRQLIKDLIDALEASGLTELEYSKDGVTLRLAKGAQAPSAAPVAAAPISAPVPVPAVAELVTAPLYGVVHLQRAPGAPPFVVVGQAIEVGHVLCTIEAMKVFTDVRADRAGTVAEILAASGQEVEAGQTLLRLA